MKRFFRTKLFNLLLFIVTFATTTLAGAEWIWGRPFWVMPYEKIADGLYYSIPFLLILTVHEFGHYIAAKLYKVKVTLPYYIPFYLPSMSIGTMGAVIRMKSALASRKQFFDIGIAGPLAGFVIAVFILIYGFTNLPPAEKVYEIHPEYENYGRDYSKIVYSYDFQRAQDSTMHKQFGVDWEPQPEYPNVALGSNLLFAFFENYVVPEDQKDRIPNKYEMMHYPWLLAGYLALFFTALNLLPIGQLDGGHILYGLIGYKNNRIASAILFTLFVAYAGMGLVTPYNIYGNFYLLGVQETSALFFVPFYIGFLTFLFTGVSKELKNSLLLAVSVFTAQFLLAFIFPKAEGYVGWMVFAFLLSRVLGVYHPPAYIDRPLDLKRKVLGWISLVVFILCFTPAPLVMK